MPERLILERLASPVGTILIVCDELGHLRALDFADCEERMHRLLRQQVGVIGLRDGFSPGQIREALTAYFEGHLEATRSLILRTGGTPFQRQVWAALRDIPAGSTSTYGELAARIGRETACRAVGLANGANPIAIVLPCHRVIGHNRRLTGYGGGLERKAWLLRHEGALHRGAPERGLAG